MYIMKQRKNITAQALLLFMALMFSSLAANAQFPRGEKCVGPKLGYVSKNRSASAGLVFQYSFSKHLRIAPEIGCVFKHRHLDAFTIDLNLHSPFTFTGERAALYPLAGLNYSSWNYSLPKELYDQSDDVSTRTSRLGLNLGAGFEMRCSNSLKIGFEAKYTLIKNFSGTGISAMVCYIF